MTPPRVNRSVSGWSAISDAARYPRPVWRSERAYVLTTIAGVVGLGNVWRFPYMAGLHDGGSFVVAYVVCVLAVAVPLATLESAAGSLGRRSPVGAFRRATGRRGVALGWATIAVIVAILSYYLVVTGWTLGYMLDAVRGTLRPFADFVDGHTSLWLFLAVGVVVLVVLLRGVEAFERAALILVPVLVVIIAGLAVYSQGLDGASQARVFYFGVRTESLLDPATWRAAAGQAFYSIGVGQGLLIAYGSFVPAGTNLMRSTTTIALTNSAVSIIAGVLVFGVAFTFGISPAEGSQLSFTVFPAVFAELPGGRLIAVAFFVSLFLAGFTSCLGAAIVVLSTVRDELGLTKRTAATATVCGIVALGVPSALSFTDVGLAVAGRPFLDLVDQVTGSGVIVVLGLVGASVLARSLPPQRLDAAFGADTVRFGPLVLGPRTVVKWTMVLPVVAALVYVVGSVV